MTNLYVSFALITENGSFSLQAEWFNEGTALLTLTTGEIIRALETRVRMQHHVADNIQVLILGFSPQTRYA